MDEDLYALLERKITEKEASKKKPKKSDKPPKHPTNAPPVLSGNVLNMYELMPKDLLLTHENPNEHLHGLKLPLRACVVAPSGSGKTNWLVNLLALFGAGKGTFHHIWIVTKNADEPLYKWLSSLNDRIKIVEGVENVPTLDKLDKDYNNLVCFDDLVLEKNQQRISNYYIRCRKLNCSVIYLSQSYFLIPKIIRNNCSYLILLKLSGEREINLIMKESAVGLPKEELLRLYKEATMTKFTPLIIDFEQPDVSRKYKKGFTEYLHVQATEE